jgi:hypothetical protein
MRESGLQSANTTPRRGWRQIVARLARMNGREMLDRGHQEFSKRTDAIFARFGFDFARNAIVAGPVKPARFFFSPASIPSILALLRQRFPQQVEQIQEQAGKICNHRFDLLGYENLSFGDPIDWSLDAVHGKRAPRKPFHKIHFLGFQEVGDSKVTWELNRHQHLVTLAKAYRLTGDSRYAHELLRQWKHWHAANPYPVGVNWASSLEVAFRCLSWMWMFHLLEGTPALPPNFRAEWLRAQALCGRHIERYLSTYFSPNTHLLGEGVALFFLGTLCPELSAAERWKSNGWEIVVREAVQQVRADGFHFEQSTYYHVYAVDFFLHALILASLNGVPIPPGFEGTVQRMLNALSLLSRAGPPPRFGDDDGGRLFDPRRNRNEHLLDPLSTGAVLFHRADFKALAGELREETVWLLGAAGVEEFERLQAQAPEGESVALAETGLYLLTASEPRSQLVIDAGPQGAQGAGHGHADALSISLQSGGQTLLLDPGTLEYVGASDARDHFRGTAMHSTLRVDEASQAEPAGPFSWGRLTHATVEQWVPGKTFTLFSGKHDGYARQSPPVVHRRWVISVNGLFLVRDVAEGQGEQKLNIAWHLGPEMFAEADHRFRTKGSSRGLLVLPAEGHGWTEETLRDRWSPAYGAQAPATTLNFSLTTKLPAEFATLLLRLEDTSETSQVAGDLTLRTVDAESGVRAYRFKRQGEEHLFIFAQHKFAQQKPWICASVASDAKFVYWKRKDGGENEIVVFCDGSYVEINRHRVLSTTRPVSRCELVVTNGAPEVFCSDPDALETPHRTGSDRAALMGNMQLAPEDTKA